MLSTRALKTIGTDAGESHGLVHDTCLYGNVLRIERCCMPKNELETFLSTWDREAENTLKLLRALPATQYDFRPDAGGRSLGELAWHLAEGDAYISYGIEKGQFTLDAKPPNIERPRTVDGLSSGYEQIHREAV